MPAAAFLLQKFAGRRRATLRFPEYLLDRQVGEEGLLGP